MRKIKILIPVLILFISIGFAAVNFTLGIDGDVELTGNIDNFNVYFSRVAVNGVEDNSIVRSKVELYFSNVLDKVGTTYTVDYDITNASNLFDANITLTCTPSNEYISIVNDFDSSTNLSALETRTGTLTLKKIKSVASSESFFEDISCSFVATPIERETIGSVEEANPFEPDTLIEIVKGDGTKTGDELNVGGEHFYVVSNDGTDVVLLAKYNLEVGNSCPNEVCTPILNSSGIQDEDAKGFVDNTNMYGTVPFVGDVYWLDGGNLLPKYGTSYPAYVYDENSDLYIYVNNYESYLEGLGLTIKESRLIKIEELVSLGCSTTENTCSTSSHEWIASTTYWSGSVFIDGDLWIVSCIDSGYFVNVYFGAEHIAGVRPVIVLSSDSIPKPESLS